MACASWSRIPSNAQWPGMKCVPIETEIAARAGDYLRAFHASHAAALGDALIAATASIHQLSLWTQNRKHFPMKDVQFFTLDHR